VRERITLLLVALLAIQATSVYGKAPAARVQFAAYPSYECPPDFLGPHEQQFFECVKVRRRDTLAKLFGSNWEIVSRINKVNPLVLKIGMILKVPRDFEWAKTYSPLPDSLPQVRHLKQFVLIDLGGQYLAGYENGKQMFWYPISSGFNPRQTPHAYIRDIVRIDSIQSGRMYKDSLPDLSTPTGFFSVLWKDSTHVSGTFFKIDSLTSDSIGAPMPWGMMFFPAYWEHGTGDNPWGLPGYPASHGCVRTFDKDAEALYRWVKHRTLILIVENREEIDVMLGQLPKGSRPSSNTRQN